jgi:hypothetical protein
LSPTTVVTTAIALVAIARLPPSLLSPSLLPPLPLPSSLLATLIAVAITLFIVFDFTHPPSSLPSHCRSEGGGEENHPDPVRNPTLHHLVVAVAFAVFAARATDQERPV